MVRELIKQSLEDLVDTSHGIHVAEAVKGVLFRTTCSME